MRAGGWTRRRLLAPWGGEAELEEGTNVPHTVQLQVSLSFVSNDLRQAGLQEALRVLEGCAQREFSR